jgi:hypothetical protein
MTALVRHPIALGVAFVLVHLWLGWVALVGRGYPMGDVLSVYRFWIDHALATGQWVGLDTTWVYPIVALVPMVLAQAFGSELYGGTWLGLVLIADAAAFAVLVGRRRDAGRARAGWWWLAFLVALGPVAVARIDAVTVAFAMSGLLLVVRRPLLAGVLLAVATWIKVWPAALIAAAVVAVRGRVHLLIGAAATTLVVLVAVIALGGAPTVFSFLTLQSGRGLQIEAPFATPGMWAAFAGGPWAVVYDRGILTYQLEGPGAALLASTTTPLLALTTGLLVVAGLVATRRGARASEVLPPLALAVTVALILFNKVGSPQFVSWLAVPIVVGLVVAARGRPSFRVPATLGVVIAALTQAFYPYLYDQLLGLDFTLLLVLTARNVLYLALLVWAVRALVAVAIEAGRGPVEVEPSPAATPPTRPAVRS